MALDLLQKTLNPAVHFVGFLYKFLRYLLLEEKQLKYLLQLLVSFVEIS